MNLLQKAQIIADHITLDRIKAELTEAEEVINSSDYVGEWLDNNIAVLKKAVELSE